MIRTEALTLSAHSDQSNLLTSRSYLPPAAPPWEAEKKPLCESQHDGFSNNWQ